MASHIEVMMFVYCHSVSTSSLQANRQVIAPDSLFVIDLWFLVVNRPLMLADICWWRWHDPRCTGHTLLPGQAPRADNSQQHSTHPCGLWLSITAHLQNIAIISSSFVLRFLWTSETKLISSLYTNFYHKSLVDTRS